MKNKKIINLIFLFLIICACSNFEALATGEMTSLQRDTQDESLEEKEVGISYNQKEKRIETASWYFRQIKRQILQIRWDPSLVPGKEIKESDFLGLVIWTNHGIEKIRVPEGCNGRIKKVNRSWIPYEMLHKQSVVLIELK